MFNIDMAEPKELTIEQKLWGCVLDRRITWMSRFQMLYGIFDDPAVYQAKNNLIQRGLIRRRKGQDQNIPLELVVYEANI